MARVGTILDGKYEILKQIGQGGMSIVYVAMDLRLNKQWAVKEIKKNQSGDTRTLLKGLRMEANILKRVDHPVLPRIVDIIDFKGTVFVVMDYIEGHTLNQLLKREGAQPQEKVIEWAKDLCGALNYLHFMNPPIIYRDMKPSNIMVKPDGRIKLIDFGAAKELNVGNLADTTALGTRGYAAPEQFGDARGHGIYRTDERTDIYSLGTTLYHTVTGKNPCEPPYVIKPIREWNPALSSGLEKIICKCTMSNPEERYQSCSELLFALEHYTELEDEFRKTCFKRMRSFFISAGLTVCFGAAAITGYAGMRREQKLNYENLITEGYHHVIRGEYEDAATTYVNAITNVDGNRNTAYLELLDLYINYLDDPETGLSKVTYYINQGYSNIDRKQELLLQVAMDYFDVIQDYKTSAYYFGMLNEKDYPAASYYSTIARAMSELNVDYNTLLTNLLLFENENDGMAISANKLMNYRLLCVVYSRNLNQLEMADEYLVSVALKGLELLEKYEDDSVKAEYYTIYNQYMAQGYEHLGGKFMVTDKKRAIGNYKKALECCDLILGIISNDVQYTISSISDVKLREAKFCQKADILEALGEYEKACKVYEEAEKEYYNNSISLYTGHLSLLCKMQEKITPDVERWEYTKLHELYQRGNKVPGIHDDYRWKQLMIKLSPLFERKGV